MFMINYIHSGFTQKKKKKKKNFVYTYVSIIIDSLDF